MSDPTPSSPLPGSTPYAQLRGDQQSSSDTPPLARPAQTFHDANPRSTGHSPARDRYDQLKSASSEPAERAAGDPAPDGTTADQPTASSSDKVKIGRYEVSEQDIGSMMERQAIEDQRRLTLPATPNDYKLEISPDAKLPGGVEYRFDGNDPSMVAVKNWAHGRGLDQGALSELLTLYASHVTQQEAVLAERSRAEIAKAGPNAPQRVDAVGRWITGMVGEADAAPIRATLVTDSHLRFYETLMTKLTSQGSASFSQQHRVPAEERGIPGFENMSFEQRRYAQDQQAARRR